MTKQIIEHAPKRPQAFFWLLVLVLIPSLFFFRMKIQSFFYTKKQCNESRRHNWQSFDVAVPPGYSVHGIDVSHYSCTIDWEEVKKMNQNGVRVDFAYMRATRGLELLDYKFNENWETAREANILRGAYHFFTFRDNAIAQAEFFLQHALIDIGDLPPVLDIEEDKISEDRKLDKAVILRGIRDWLIFVERKTGMRPMIYTNLDYYKRYINGNFDGYPIWIASYNNIKGVTLPDNRKWWFWQFSDEARCNGVSERADLNVFIGNETQLAGICKKN